MRKVSELIMLRLMIVANLVLILFAGCMAEKKPITGRKDFEGDKIVAVLNGITVDKLVLKRIPDAVACILSAKSGKGDMIADGIIITEKRSRQIKSPDRDKDPKTALITIKKNLVNSKNGEIQTLDDLKDKKIGVLLGSVHDIYAHEKYPHATILQYESQPDLAIALKTGKIDAAFYCLESLSDIKSKINDLKIVESNLFFTPMAAGFNQNNDTLRGEFNAFLSKIKTDGVYDDMITRHIKQCLYDIPTIENSRFNGYLAVGTVQTGGFPFTGIKDNQPVGLEIELATRFAAYLSKKLIISDMKFGNLILAVTQNKVDVIISSIMVTEERARQIDFSDPYYHLSTCVITRGTSVAEPQLSFFRSIITSFYSNIIQENRYLLIVNGLKTTAIISFLAMLFGTLLGALVCFMRMTPKSFVQVAAKIYIFLLRGTPMLVILMIIFYVVFAKVTIEPVLVAVLAFGMNFAAYVSEMFRTGIESIDKGQKEASIASGFTRVQTFIYIIMPQSAKLVFPVYKGEFISLVKMTSIVGYIAVQDLTKASDIIRSRTFDAFFPLVMVAILYFALSGLLSLGLDYIEKKMDTRIM